MAPAQPHVPPPDRERLPALIPPVTACSRSAPAAGDLLAALAPVGGVGVDVSRAWSSVRAARASRAAVRARGRRDARARADVRLRRPLRRLPYVHDFLRLFETVARHSHRRSRIVINSYSPAWRPVLAARRVAGPQAAQADPELGLARRRAERCSSCRASRSSRARRDPAARSGSRALDVRAQLLRRHRLALQPARRLLLDRRAAALRPHSASCRCRSSVRAATRPAMFPQIVERLPKMGRAPS